MLLVPVDAVEYQALVRLGYRSRLVLLRVQKLQLRLRQLHPQPGFLDRHFHVYGGIGLEPHDKLVSRLPPPNLLLRKQVARNVLQLNPDLALVLVERFTRLDDERDAVPPLVAHVKDAKREGGRLGPRGDGGVVEVGFAARPVCVLPQGHVIGAHGLYASQHLELLVAYIVRRQRARLLHGDEAQQLKQVILYDVAYDAVLIKISAAALRAKRFLEEYLHVGDVIAIPQRREEPVGEPHDHEVLRELFAEVVVDPVELRLGEELGDSCAELL